ncbi:MAG: dihydrodipicolinate reductase [Acidobacteria bacterium]|nr:dihydrodipicolinate reductase [Acidobacteriota bacterium]
MTDTAARVRVLLVGHGRMGRLVEQLAEASGVQIVGHLTRGQSSDATLPQADVAIDFSTAEAVYVNAPRLAARGMSLVIGTTGWQASESQLRDSLGRFPVGVIAAPNFAIGVNAFSVICERAAELLVRGSGFAPWIHEAHHAAKKDAPSGTAIALRRVVEAAGSTPVDIASTRAGHIPGTHTVGFDAVGEGITLTHTARDRSPFARGALEAARWIHGRRGWFTMRDMLGV